MIITGGMAYTFLKHTQNMTIGKSLFDQKGFEIIPEIMELAKKHNVNIHLPIDFKIADDFKNEANSAFVTVAQGIPDGW